MGFIVKSLAIAGVLLFGYYLGGGCENRSEQEYFSRGEQKSNELETKLSQSQNGNEINYQTRT